MTHFAKIKNIEYVLGEQEISDELLIKENPTWNITNISLKTGIKIRYAVKPNQCASDLAVLAAEELFNQANFDRQNIDYILFCTQSADHFLPATACLMQERLKIKQVCGAVDYNGGCSGFVSGLGIAKGLIETKQVNNILLITADTYSRFIHPKDKSVRLLFSDAATAILLTNEAQNESIGPFSYFTNGKGANNLIVRDGAMRYPINSESKVDTIDCYGNTRSNVNLYMNGPEIASFSMVSVPTVLNKFLENNKLSYNDIDFFVFHQANKHMLEQLRCKLNIPTNKFHSSSCDIGNTVASTIPIALKRMQLDGLLSTGKKLLLLGFGVGYSIGITLINWV